jgi:hypothetical protein
MRPEGYMLSFGTNEMKSKDAILKIESKLADSVHEREVRERNPPLPLYQYTRS